MEHIVETEARTSIHRMRSFQVLDGAPETPLVAVTPPDRDGGVWLQDTR